MTPRLMTHGAQTFCFAPAQTLASPVRWSSAVDSTIELACIGVAHRKARAALYLASVGSGMAAGTAFGQHRVRDVGAVQSFSTICNVNVRMTHATSRTGHGRARRQLTPLTCEVTWIKNPANHSTVLIDTFACPKFAWFTALQADVYADRHPGNYCDSAHVRGHPPEPGSG